MKAVFSIACLLVIATQLALSQSRTKIRDTFTTPSGALVNGQVTILATTTFTTASGTTVPAGQRLVVQVRNGSFSADLWPNSGSTPSGTSYTVELAFGASPTVEIWVIPTTSSVLNRAAVVGSIVPVPKTQITLGQLTQSNAANGQVVTWNNTAKLWEPATPASGGVTSFIGRSGAVVAAANDYSATQVSNTPSGGIAATTVQSALNELDSEKAAVSHAHSAAEITSGSIPLDRGGTGSNLSATGGTGQFLRQSSTGGAVTVGAITAGDIPSSVDASKIADGSVSNANFQNLAGVTSAIQTQLNARITGSGTTNQTAFWSGTSAQSGMSGTAWNDSIRRLTVTSSVLANEFVQVTGGNSSGVFSSNRSGVSIRGVAGRITSVFSVSNDSGTACEIFVDGGSSDPPRLAGCDIFFPRPPKLDNSVVYTFTSSTNSNTSGTVNKNWPTNGSNSGTVIVRFLSITGNTTLNMTGSTADLVDGYVMLMEFCQDAVGGRTLTLGTGFQVPSFTLDPVANRCTLLQTMWKSSISKAVKIAQEVSY